MITITTEGWEGALADIGILNTNVKTAIAKAVREVSEQVAERVQSEMPVDTGWAQARWANESFGGIWEVSDDGMTITQGSSIDPYEYIIRLNEGSSTQAPAGFIDAAGAWGEELMPTVLDGELDPLIG